jgi:2-polyprenyl-3-methyl-5-hydroxy-6-metoxy-1,4-benzoquinol methylase
MLLFRLIIRKILLFLNDIPRFNITIQYILRPIYKHKRFISATLKNISYSKNLDYGCGEGLFSNCFIQSKYIGYDPAIKKITYAQKRFVNYKFLSEIPDFRMFDLFFFNLVLHHMTPSQVHTLINKVSKSIERNAHLMIIEGKPIYQQKNYIYKLILRIEAKIHYSELRPINFYKEELQNNGFALVDERDLGAGYLLLFKR